MTSFGTARIQVKTPASSRSGHSKKWIDTRAASLQKGFDLINNMAMKSTLDFTRVSQYQLEDKYLTPSDIEILMDNSVKDLSTVASPQTSLLEFEGLTQRRLGAVKVKVGDKVNVRVVLKDAKGRPVLKGGHEVRVWMVGQGTVKKAAAVDVTDLHNGTYVASLPVLFCGKVQVRAALINPREVRRIVLVLLNTMKLITQITCAFVNGKTKQVTLCSFIPVVPGFPEVCNLTEQNGGIPWYCGKPNTPGLLCDHWADSSPSGLLTHYPASDTENALIDRFASERSGINKLQGTLSFVAEEDKQRLQRVNKTCVPVKPRDTWTEQSPSGYWENKVWRLLNNCPLPRLNSSVAYECLRDTHFITFGDSNARQIMERMQSVTKCRLLADPLRHRHPNMLHVPSTHLCQKHNLYLYWYPHAYPFFTGYGEWSDARVKYSLGKLLPTLPDNRKYVIVLHLYVHFGVVHTYAYVQHVRNAVNAIRNFLKRVPSVTVFVRGPHAIGGNKYRIVGDYHAERALRILRQEFQDLKDQVLFLNAWDMTVANENLDLHPELAVRSILCQLILSHLCPQTV